MAPSAAVQASVPVSATNTVAALSVMDIEEPSNFEVK
jgi:hypothetical protein